MRLFLGLLNPATLAHVVAGGQALEKWGKAFTHGPNAPACFRGKDFVKLYDHDRDRLIKTARRLGVRVVKVDRPGGDWQHIDLVGKPMERALREAEAAQAKAVKEANETQQGLFEQ